MPRVTLWLFSRYDFAGNDAARRVDPVPHPGQAGVLSDSAEAGRSRGRAHVIESEVRRSGQVNRCQEPEKMIFIRRRSRLVEHFLMIHSILVYGFPCIIILLEWILRKALQMEAYGFIGPTLAGMGIGITLPLTRPENQSARLHSSTQRLLERGADRLLSTRVALDGGGMADGFRPAGRVVPVLLPFCNRRSESEISPLVHRNGYNQLSRCRGIFH